MINVTLLPIIPRNHNYAYILEAPNGEVAVVDPGDAGPFIEELESRDLKPDVVLITHHHWDHIDGLADLLAWHACPVAGPERGTDLIKPLDILLDEASEFCFGGERVRILETPGHTPEHICFYFEHSGFLLAGDTMFSMGCGRLLDGRPEEMWTSLRAIAQLPDETLVYCGHEYTLANAQFCLSVEPQNETLKKRLAEVKDLLENGKPTIPTTVKAEKETNLFLRAQSAERFALLRSQKDCF